MPAATLPPNEAERLAALHAFQILDTASDKDFDNIVKLAARLTGCPVALVSLVDKDRQWFKARHGIDAVETPRDQAFCAHAILDPKQPLVVTDATQDARFLDNPLVTGQPGIRFYAGIPLVAQNNHVLGTLCVIDTQPKHIDPEIVDGLASLARTVVTTLELHRATRQLRDMASAAEDRFARVVEASPTALLLVEPSGLIWMMNQRAERMFGYSRTELLGQRLERLMPERFRARHVGLRQQFQGNMSDRMMGDGLDLYGLRKDGTEFPLEIGLNPVHLDETPMVMAGIIDITARREAERHKERQRLELERSNADLEEFAYAASHDLKAPLRAIGHLVEWIQEDIEATATPETIDNLKLLRGRTARLQMLLDGLLAYSRVGRANSEVENVDVAAVVRDIVSLLGPSPGFTVACEGPMPILRTRRVPLQVTLENLISNSLKHHDRQEGRVTIRMTLANQVAEFHVSDDGPGIAPRFHDRIFVIFQTLESRDDVDSSGIGLAIVKKKIQAHGGRIWVESAPPTRGTTFKFTWRETLS